MSYRADERTLTHDPPLASFILSNGEEAIDYLAGSGKYADREKFEFPGCIITDLKCLMGTASTFLGF